MLRIHAPAFYIVSPLSIITTRCALVVTGFMTQIQKRNFCKTAQASAVRPHRSCRPGPASVGAYDRNLLYLIIPLKSLLGGLAEFSSREGSVTCKVAFWSHLQVSFYCKH